MPAQVNLYNPALLEARSGRPGGGLVVLAMVAAVAVAGYGIARQRADALESRVRAGESELAALRAAGPTGGATLPASAGFSARMTALVARLPGRVALTGYHLGAGLALEGRADRPSDFPRYLEQLREEPLLRGQSFGRLEIVGSPGAHAPDAVEFRLAAGLERP